MMPFGHYTSPGRIVRAALAAATIGFGALGLMMGAPRMLMAAGAFGIMWTLWDIIWDRVFAPFGDWATRMLTEGSVGVAQTPTRPNLQDTIRLLENHLEHGASRSVEIQAAIRLEEIYRTVRKQPEKARDVVKRISAKYPDAMELERLLKAGGSRRTDGPTDRRTVRSGCFLCWFSRGGTAGRG